MHILKRTQWASIAGLLCLITACSRPGTEATPQSVEVSTAAPTAEAVPAQPEDVAEAKPVLQTVDQRASYGVGYGTGSTIARDRVIEVDRRALLEGLLDGLNLADSQVEEATLKSAFAELDRRVQAKTQSMSAANLAAAQAFLEQNSRRKGVKVTGSGLQIEVLSASIEAEARQPAAADTVSVHYHGTLVDGTIFDSSIRRGEPIQIPLAGVIPGWREALRMMTVGDRWKIYLPPRLGYGASWTGSIPPNSALIFEIQLLTVVGADALPAALE